MSMTAATLLIFAAAAGGDGNTQPSTSQPADTRDADDPIICQTDKVLGSRIKRKRICMRRTEWQRQHQEEKQMIDRTQILRGVNPPG